MSVRPAASSLRTPFQRTSFLRAPLLLLALPAVVLPAAVLSAQAPAASPPAQPAQAQPWKQIPIPPLHPFKPTEPRRIVLANGLVLFLQEDHELPFIDGTVLIRGGSRDEPAAKLGLVNMYGQAWRTSGSVSTPGDRLDTELAVKAASIETGGGMATTTLEWGGFSQDFDSIFAQAMDLLFHPDFKADKLALARRQIDTAIARRNDEADSIAAREAAKLAYGAANPYGRYPEYSTVAAVTLDDLKAWHERTVVPNNMIVAVEGDFDSAAMEAKLRKVFEPLRRGAAISPLKLEYPGPKPGVYFADKEDVDQSTIEIVGLGTERNNPDYYALSVMNEIFSGGFGSRVVQSVRTRLGLAYSVNGNFGAQYDHPGVFLSEAGTKSSSTVAAARAILAEIERLKTDPPTSDELRKAKDQVTNSFIFRYDTPEKVLNEQIVLDFYGYPRDFLEKYRDGVERVTAADVTRVANKYVDPAKLAVVVVGNQSEISPALSTLGPVTTLDVAIPPPPPAAAPAEGAAAPPPSR